MLVVGVKFRSGGKVYYFDPQNMAEEIFEGTKIIVETQQGLELTTCVRPPIM